MSEDNPNSDVIVGNAEALPEEEDNGTVLDNTSTTSITPAATTGNQVVGQSGIDPTRLAGELVGDPSQFMGSDMTLADKVEGVDPNTVGTNIDGSDPTYSMDADALDVTTETGVVNTATGVTEQDARTYTAETAADRVAAQDMDAATGEVSDKAVINVDDVVVDVDDVESRVSGFATQNISKVIEHYMSINY